MSKRQDRKIIEARKTKGKRKKKQSNKDNRKNKFYKRINR